jgi:hypothetical protein
MHGACLGSGRAVAPVVKRPAGLDSDRYAAHSLRSLLAMANPGLCYQAVAVNSRRSRGNYLLAVRTERGCPHGRERQLLSIRFLVVHLTVGYNKARHWHH